MLFAGSLSRSPSAARISAAVWGNVIAVEIQNLIQAKRLAIDLQETNLIAWL
jgi:hypothetical protein